MLRINKVSIRGFGPYIDQSISFSKNPGVNIIWGDNGFGKTTFINALKFGFYGELPNEDNKDKSILDLINVHNKRKKDYSFNVIIEFELNGDKYVLTRFAEPKLKDIAPERYNDFDIRFFLQKNGDVLSLRESNMTLDRTMPENTSRFFIFDGELLEEYNKLAEESQASLKLKESIEQILGLPIITNAKRHIKELKQNISNQLIDLSKRQADDKKNHKKLETENQKLQDRINERESISNDKEKFQIEYDEIYEQIKRGPSGAKIKEYKEMEDSLKLIKNEITTKKEDIKNAVLTSWRGLTYGRLKSYRIEANDFIKKYDAKKKEHDINLNNVNIYTVSIHKRNCEVCRRSLSVQEVDEMNNKLASIEKIVPYISDEDVKKYTTYKRSLETIDEKLLHFRVEQIKIETLSNAIDDLEIQEYTTVEKMKDIQKSIEDFNKQKDHNIILENQKEKALENLSNSLQSITKLDEEIKSIKENIKKISDIIKNDINDEDLNSFKSKEIILNDFENLLEEAIDVFRQDLKNRVQHDAEKLFVKFANQKDFKGLKINENYGLDIVHNSGEIVPVKSSGYSHIVSLCLIGALHKNTPVQGPVFIDSPSGRLDINHKNNLINILTDISDQVILLLYNGELDTQLIRQNLKSSLIDEFELLHENDDAFKTIIRGR